MIISERKCLLKKAAGSVLLLLFVVSSYAQQVSFQRAIELTRAGVTSTNTREVEHLLSQSWVNFEPYYRCDKGLFTNESPQAYGENKLGLASFGRGFECDAPATRLAAVTYVLLSWTELRASLIKKENYGAAQMTRVERARVVAGIDDQSFLTQAGLMEATSRAGRAFLEREETVLREILASLIKLPSDQITIEPETIPAFGHPTHLDATTGAEKSSEQPSIFQMVALVTNLTAKRDAAQFEYCSADRDAIRAEQLEGSPFHEVLSSRVFADDKLNTLLQAARDLQVAEVVLLDLSSLLGRSESGLLNDGTQLKNGSNARAMESPSVTKAAGSASVSGAPGSNAALLIMPTNGTLEVGACRQLAAISINNGLGSDATLTVPWTSSSESLAIVSTSGLVTAVRSGPVRISAKAGNVERSLSMEIMTKSESTTEVPALGSRPTAIR